MSNTPYPGVYHDRGRYRVKVRQDKKLLYLGSFDTAERAKAAIDEYRLTGAVVQKRQHAKRGTSQTYGQGRHDAQQGTAPQSDNPQYRRGYESVGRTRGPIPNNKPPSEIHVAGDIACIRLVSGHEAIVDAADVALVEGHRWGATYASNCTKIVPRQQQGLLMPHVILGKPEHRHVQIRHKNGNGLDNRRENLWVVDLKSAWEPTAWTPGLARPKHE